MIQYTINGSDEMPVLAPLKNIYIDSFDLFERDTFYVPRKDGISASNPVVTPGLSIVDINVDKVKASTMIHPKDDTMCCANIRLYKEGVMSAAQDELAKTFEKCYYLTTSRSSASIVRLNSEDEEIGRFVSHYPLPEKQITISPEEYVEVKQGDVHETFDKKELGYYIMMVCLYRNTKTEQVEYIEMSITTVKKGMFRQLKEDMPSWLKLFTLLPVDHEIVATRS